MELKPSKKWYVASLVFAILGVIISFALIQYSTTSGPSERYSDFNQNDTIQYEFRFPTTIYWYVDTSNIDDFSFISLSTGSQDGFIYNYSIDGMDYEVTVLLESLDGNNLDYTIYEEQKYRFHNNVMENLIRFEIHNSGRYKFTSSTTTESNVDFGLEAVDGALIKALLVLGIFILITTISVSALSVFIIFIQRRKAIKKAKGIIINNHIPRFNDHYTQTQGDSYDN